MKQLSFTRKTGLFVLGVLGLSSLAVAQSGVLHSLFSSDYLPHRYCYLAKPWLVRTNVSSDTIIALSYMTITACLIGIAYQLRSLAMMRKYLWIFISFGVFIIACGITHAMEVLTVWKPFYPMSAAFKVLCALASMPTAILFAGAAPRLTEAIRNYLKKLEEATEQRDLAVTQLEREQLMREKRIEALSHMAGGLAHEISNPLAIMHGKASDLQRLVDSGTLTDADVRETAVSLVLTAERAMKILRGLRGFGREAAKDPFEAATVEGILEGCIELQESRMERERVDLVLQIEDGLPDIWCRETQIGQILTNLINNGYDAVVLANAEDRWIEIKAASNGGFVTIDVMNSGPMIEDSLKPHLMEPFFTTKEFKFGTGVGLSLSRAIAQDHGGTLILRDGTEHTCFRLTLPVRPAEQEDGSMAFFVEPLRPGGALSS